MKTLQQQEQQPVNATMSQGTATSLQPLALEGFTPYEIAMAKVLTGLSESITSTGKRGASEASVALGSSSARSANGQSPARELVLPRNPGAGGDGDEEEDKQEVLGSQRKQKHYRSIAEIYCAIDRFVRYNPRNKKE
jgi:hypothetical protein